MAAGENGKEDGNQGFAGLSSLISDVDTSAASTANEEPAAAGQNAERPSSKTGPTQPQPSQRQAIQTPPKPSSRLSSTDKWVLGLATTVLGFFYILSFNSETSRAPSYSAPTQSAAPSYSLPVQPQVQPRPQESKPPVGQDLVFSTAQIRYCSGETIRLDGAKSALNNYIESDVDRFNSMVADYNSRCGSFRYRSGALENAQREMEPFRSELLADGRALFGGIDPDTVVWDASGGTTSVENEVAPVAEQTQSASAPIPITQPQSNRTTAANVLWDAALAEWTQRNTAFLSDPTRNQAFTNAVQQVDQETNGTLSDSDLISAGYQRAAISTGWPTVVPTLIGKPISDRASKNNGRAAVQETECEYKAIMTAEDMRACGIGNQ